MGDDHVRAKADRLVHQIRRAVKPKENSVDLLCLGSDD